MDTERTPTDPQGVLVQSARGWHRIQVAVLGFIGLCGVLQAGEEVPGPGWLDGLAGWLALAALAVACVATYLVGRVAWPWRPLPVAPTDRPSPATRADPGAGNPSGPSGPARGPGGAGPAEAAASSDLDRRSRTLRLGVTLTYVAVAAISLAALTNWWPNGEAEGPQSGGVRVTDNTGRSWCGRLVDAPAGSLRIVTDQGATDVDGATVTEMLSVDNC